MDRRSFVLGGAGALLARSVRAQARAVRVAVEETRSIGAIPAGFLGLGYEITSVARPGLLSASNRAYVELVRTLGSAGVLRVGGNTSDYARYTAAGAAEARPKGTVVNRAALQDLAEFCRATGWQLIWGLNLGDGSAAEAVEEAQAVSRAAGASLLAFEIGNEPDLFVGEGHRKGAYIFSDYLAEYTKFKAAIRAKLPEAPFAGPDAASATEWVRQFAEAEAGDVKLLTHHYYRGQQGPASTYDLLLHPDPNLAAMLKAMQRAQMVGHGVPFRICETNSFSGGGRPGVSGSFGAALWVLDYFWTLASHGAGGVNLETGVNQLGFVSSYSPIGDEAPTRPAARPEYYGMLAFAQGARGRRVPVTADPGALGPLNLTSYAAAAGGQVTVTLINKDRTDAGLIEIATETAPRSASVLRLAAPALESSDGVTLGGARVTAEGKWSPRAPEKVQVSGGKVRLSVPPASAALVTVDLT